MTLHEQLRAIADRLEAAEAERVACMDMLAAFMQGWQTDGRSVEPWADDPDSAAVLVAAEDQPGAPEDVSAPNGSGDSPGLPPPAPIDAEPSAIEQAAPGTDARSARSLLPERDRLVLAPARPRPGEKRTCPKCEKTWPPQGFLTHVRWCSGTKGK